MYIHIRERILSQPHLLTRTQVADWMADLEDVMEPPTIEKPENPLWAEIYRFSSDCVVIGYGPKVYEDLLRYMRALAIFESVFKDEQTFVVLSHVCWVMLATMIPPGNNNSHSLVSRKRVKLRGSFSARIFSLIAWMGRNSESIDPLQFITSGWVPTGSLYIDDSKSESILFHRVQRYIIPPDPRPKSMVWIRRTLSQSSMDSPPPQPTRDKPRREKTCLCF